MRERFLSESAVMLPLTQETSGETEILLQKRQNTGKAYTGSGSYLPCPRTL